ncbi:hypothetical protein AB6A40_003943 [Gnathostoma spinigerum]|uniref:Uncharacterized protein n=1 Tax=Gnathostoma spinigerum TaxID=75299 RepID=A0ABD6EB06_9BILA
MSSRQARSAGLCYPSLNAILASNIETTVNIKHGGDPGFRVFGSGFRLCLSSECSAVSELSQCSGDWLAMINVEEVLVWWWKGDHRAFVDMSQTLDRSCMDCWLIR